MSRSDPQFKLRLPENLKAWVEEEAKKQHRSINGQIIYLIEQAQKKEV